MSYRPTPNSADNLMVRGQWFRVEGYKKPARFVGYNPDGTIYAVKPTGKGKKGRVNMKAFRLACDKHKRDVLGTIEIKKPSKGLQPRNVPIPSTHVVGLLNKFSDIKDVI